MRSSISCAIVSECFAKCCLFQFHFISATVLASALAPDETTDITTSHLTTPAKDAGQVIGYSHPTKQPKNGCKVVGYSRTQMYCLHPQALKVRNPLWAEAHAELSGVDRGCTADESATTTHRRLILAALFSFLMQIGVRTLTGGKCWTLIDVFEVNGS